MEYITISQDDTSMAGAEGYRIRLLEVAILKPIDRKYLNTLITHYHGYYEFETEEDGDYGNDFNSPYNNWLEVYIDILEGSTVDSLRMFEVEIFSNLYKNGYISNGWVSHLHYYAAKYRNYCLEDAPPKRVFDDGKIAYTAQQLIEELEKQGTIKEFEDGYFLKAE